MSETKRDFFVSYNKADAKWAQWIAEVLEAEGYTTILQAWDFRPGGNFVLDMHNALISSERFIAVLSPNYLSSSYAQAEFAAAFTRDPNSEKRVLIPVRVADFEPEGLYAAIVYIDLFGLDDKSAKKALIQGVDIESIPRNRPGFPGSAKVRFPGSLPFNNLPYIRNNYFSGRDETLESINNAFHSKDSVTSTQIISGLGGVGKTQIALEYAYRHAIEYDWIWWVAAETEGTVMASYKDFAVKMKLLEGEQYDKDVIFETVFNWLDTHCGWLFIFDNVEEPTRDSLWWPKNNKGNILITTRKRPNNFGETIDISMFSESEAVFFLSKRTGIAEDSDGALKLSDRLGYLPLALEQAAAYIVNTDSSYSEYFGFLQEYGLDMLEDVDGVINYDRPVTATWGISINRIKDEAASQLLYLCAYLASENIVPELFSEHAEHCPSPLKEMLSNTPKVRKVWAMLVNYSLLRNQGEQRYSMHRILQEVIRKELQDDTQWAQYVLILLYVAYDFDYGNVDSHNNFLQLSPHVEAFMRSCASSLTDDDTQKLIADLYNIGGYGYDALGEYAKALEWYEKALIIREKVLGREHPDVATIYNNIAFLYYNYGDFAEASEWHGKALAIREKVLGKEHPDTAASYNNIALVYLKQGSFVEALEWFEKSLTIQEKVLDKGHPDIAATYNNIALVYSYQGDNTEALEWYEKALVIQEKVLDKEHPDIAKTYNNIAFVYSRLGEYSNALEWYEKALVVFEKVLGKEHPDVAINYNNIATVYICLGDYPEALAWNKRALLIQEKVFGKEHLDIATTCNSIALAYFCQGEYAKALEWYERALIIQEMLLGKEHLTTAATDNYIALVYSYQGEYGEALERFEKVLVVYENMLGIEHPDTMTVKENIAIAKERI